LRASTRASHKANAGLKAGAANLMNFLILYSTNSDFYMKSPTVGVSIIFRTASPALRADLGAVGDARKMQAV